MKYEIITDKEDLLVLVVNNRVIAVSQDIAEICRVMVNNYVDTVNKTQRVYEKAVMYPELDISEYKADLIDIKEGKKETDWEKLVRLADKEDKSPDNGSLGKLFTL